MAAITGRFDFVPALPSGTVTVTGATLTEVKNNLVNNLTTQLAAQNTVAANVQAALNNVNS